MSTSTDKTLDLAASHGVTLDVDAGIAVPETAIKARGYWELVWIRFKRDKLAVEIGRAHV